MTCCSVLVRHLLCFLAFLTWLLGSTMLAYTLWMLCTSSNIRMVFEGSTPATYVILGLGSLYFTNGLLGWIGSRSKRGGCMLTLFLLLGVLTIAAEIGGIISLSILKVGVSDIVEQSWTETNPKTRHIIQQQFECCGSNGPAEFAKTIEPIDASCYHNLNPNELSGEELASFNTTANNLPNEPIKVLYKHGCRDKLVNSIFKYKHIWLAVIGGFLLFQALCFCLTVSALNHKSVESTSPNRLQSPTYM